MAISLKVRCLGKLHRIHLADNGQLCLVDHPKDTRDDLLAMQALAGNEDCRCVQIYNVWKTAHHGNSDALNILPDQLKRAYKIWRSDPRAVRIVRKMLKQRGMTFLNGAIHAYPPDFVDDERNRKRQCYVVDRVVEELHRRGYVYFDVEKNDGKDSRRWGGSSIRGNGFNMTCDDNSGTPASVRFGWNQLLDISFVASREIPVSDIVDVMELFRAHSKLKDYNAERAKKEYLESWVGNRLAEVYKYSHTSGANASNSGRVGGIFNVNLWCSDPSAAAILASVVEAAAKRLHAQQRVYAPFHAPQ